jgi:hypothetical protein
MANVTTTGLAAFEIGDIESDGGIATTWTSLGLIAEGSASFNQADGTKTQFFAEQLDLPVFETVKQGEQSFNFSLGFADFTQIQKVMGGTISGSGINQKWSAPAQIPVIHSSIRIVPTSGLVLNICKASFSAKISGGFSKTDNMKIEVVATILSPDKAGEPPYSFTTLEAYLD